MCAKMKNDNDMVVIGAGGRRCWDGAALMEAHLPCQIASAARGRSSGGGGTNIDGAQEIGAKCFFCLLRS